MRAHDPASVRANTIPTVRGSFSAFEAPPRGVAVRAYEAADRARWDAYVTLHADSTFAQTSAFGDVMDRDGVERHWYLALRGGRVVGVLPMFLRTARERALFSAPGGLLADDDEVRALLVAHLEALVRETRSAYGELRDQRRPVDGLATCDEHVTMVADLCATEDAQWNALDSRARRAYRKSERAGFGITWGAANVAGFHRVLVENMRDLGTPVRGLAYYNGFVRSFGERCDVLLLTHAGRPAGGMIVVRHGLTWSDPWTSSRRRSFALAPNDCIYWEALRAAVAAGAARFDFGRSQTNSGTYRFKRKWGAVPVAVAYQYVLGTRRSIPAFAHQRAALAPASWIWKRLPVPIASTIGDPVRRLFPEEL